MKKAFLFDLDGLLVDSEPLHFEAFVTTCQEFGFSVPWDFQLYCQKAHTQSLGLKKAFLELFPEASDIWAELYHKVKLSFSSFVEKRPLDLIKGADHFLKLLIENQKKIAVVTNSSTPMVLSIMDKQPVLKMIPLWVTREDYQMAKPHPDGYLKALDVLKVAPEDAAGFEDSPRGMKALHAAGVKAIHISPYTLGENHHFHNFEELLNSPFLKELI